MSATPTSRTLKMLRDDGFYADVAERWNMHVGPITCHACQRQRGIRQDLFGFIDIVAIGYGRTIGVQATSKDGVRGRVRKILGEDLAPLATEWIRAGNELAIIGWGEDYRPENKRQKWWPYWRLFDIDEHGDLLAIDPQPKKANLF